MLAGRWLGGGWRCLEVVDGWLGGGWVVVGRCWWLGGAECCVREASRRWFSVIGEGMTELHSGGWINELINDRAWINDYDQQMIAFFRWLD